MGETKVVRLLGIFDPKIVKPLPEVLVRFDHRFCFPCNLCRNRNQNYYPNPSKGQRILTKDLLITNYVNRGSRLLESGKRLDVARQLYKYMENMKIQRRNQRDAKFVGRLIHGN